MFQKRLYELTTNFLLVFSWALVFIGFFIGLYLFAPFGLVFGLCAAFLSTTPGLTIILAIQLFFTQEKKLKELEKQTQTLNEILASLNKKID